MDLRKLKVQGVDVILAIRSEFPRARMVVLTTSSGGVQSFGTFQAGAVGYLLKNLYVQNDWARYAEFTRVSVEFRQRLRNPWPNMRPMML